MSSPTQIDHLPSHSGVAKLHALTGLRFVAAALIVIHHSRGAFPFVGKLVGELPLDMGVSFFFVLSGFILAHVYPGFEETGSVWRFFHARFARIWPAHLFTFLIAAVLLAPTSKHGTQPIPLSVTLANIAMLHAIVPKTGFFFSYNAVSWSISTEFFFYAAFPFLISKFWRTWWWKLGLALALLTGLFVICAVLPIPPAVSAKPFEINRAGLTYINPAARILEFFLGIIACHVWKAWLARRRWAVSTATIFEVLCTGVCVGGFMVLAYRTWLVGLFGENVANYLRHAGAAPAFALLIMVFANQMGYLSRFFGTRLLVLLGEISFSVYLLHRIFLDCIAQWHVRLTHQGWSDGLLFAAFWLAVLVASWTVWRCVERPARTFLLQVGRAPRLQVSRAT